MLCKPLDLGLVFSSKWIMVTASGVLIRPTRSRFRYLARSRSRSICKELTPSACFFFFFFEVLSLNVQGKFVDVSFYLTFFFFLILIMKGDSLRNLVRLCL